MLRSATLASYCTALVARYTWGMTGDKGTKTASAKQRPGTRLMATGLVILAIGILLVIVGFSTTHMEIVPGTFRKEEFPGAPTPGAWIILIVGIALAAIGFCKRLLAAVEK